MEQILHFIANFIANEVFSWFTLILACLLPLILFKFKIIDLEKSIGLAVNIGILGTFLGIFGGLYLFDESHITQSVPKLLDGLKTAFLSSIGGLAYSIYGKFAKTKVSQEEIEKEADAIDQMISILIRIEKGILNVEKGIVGDGESTLNTQIKLLRQNQNDNAKQLLNAFEEFAQKVAEQSTSEFIKALQQVVNDLNKHIHDQLGENFKLLNQSIGAMIEWQKNYLGLMERNRMLLQQVVQNIDSMEKQLRNIVDDIEVIDGFIEKIDEFLEKMNNNFDEISSLVELGPQAFKKMEQNMSDLTIKFQSNINDLYNKNQLLLDNHSKSVSEQSKQINAIYLSMDKQLKQQIDNLEKALEVELTKSLNSLGSQLASLSSKFVNDYTPLTNELRKVVELSKKINSKENNV